jgi:hypothetical protein
MDQNLIDYIKQCREQNISDEEIKTNLLGAGWKEEDINEGLKPITPIIPVGLVDNVEPKNKSSKKILKFAIIIIGILIIAGAAVAGYSYLRQSNIKNVFATTIEKMNELKTFHYEINLELSKNILDAKLPLFIASLISPVKGEETSNGEKLIIKISGDTDKTESKNIKTHIILDLDAGLFSFQKAEAKFIDGSLYIKSPEAIGLMGATSNANESQGQWLEINSSGSNPLDITTPEINLSEEQIEKIKELALSSEMVKVEKNVQKETIDNIKTSHYKFSIDSEKLKKLIVEISKIINVAENQSFGVVDIEKEIEIINSTTRIDGDLWIGKNNKLLYRGAINIIGIGVEGSENMDISIEFNFSHFNETLNITKPENIVNFNSMLNNSFDESRIKSRDARRASDIRQVALALEMYYGDKKSYPVVTGCTASNWNSLSAILKNYISSVPIDPLNSGKHVYMYASDGGKNIVRAVFESENTNLDNDIDGNVMGCNCDDPAYCIGP